MTMRFLIPLGVLTALLAMFWFGLHHDPREIPSPLLGKTAPAFDLPTLDGTPPRMTQAELHGRVRLVNFFASWCEGCQVEHPYLLELAKRSDVDLIGIDYKDADEAVRQWLDRRGDPYRIILSDAQGQTGIDWGVYGVPETFVVDAHGTILYKQIGALTPDDFARHIEPLLAANRPAAVPAATAGGQP